MNGRDLIQKILNTKVYDYEADVIIRTPDCRAYRDCNIHVANGQNGQIIMVDLIGEHLTPASSDFDLDKAVHCGHPVEDDTHLALDATIARQNIQIYNHSNYFQFKEIDYMIISASKNGFEYHEATFVESFHYTDKRGIDIKASELVDRINRHYSALGFDVCVDKTKDVYKVLIQW